MHACCRYYGTAEQKNDAFKAELIEYKATYCTSTRPCAHSRAPQLEFRTIVPCLLATHALFEPRTAAAGARAVHLRLQVLRLSDGGPELFRDIGCSVPES